MKFTKMEGCGNDYIYINCFEENVDDPSELAAKMSNRNFGVGSDGIVLIMPDDKADFRMRMFNSDGSEAEMCGNASRCIGKYVYDRGLTDKTTVTLNTLAGIKVLKLNLKDGAVDTVTVDMGEPILKAEDDIRARKEIVESVDKLSEILDKKVASFAYPNGIENVDYSLRDEQFAKEAGIDMAFSVDPGIITSKTNPLSVPRWGSMARLKFGRIGMYLPSRANQAKIREEIRTFKL